MAGTLEYDSNNSGGNWWLTDEDWYKLEAAGWTVKWIKDDPYHKGEERCLGALARTATKRFDNPTDGVKEWEQITKQAASEIGCTCCGQPHNFEWQDDDGSYSHPSMHTETSWSW